MIPAGSHTLMRAKFRQIILSRTTRWPATHANLVAGAGKGVRRAEGSRKSDRNWSGGEVRVHARIVNEGVRLCQL